ncbi:MFS transporter [Corynebacterium lizhenjunii]|uniref:MFS transporter n=1 Tax=Corynebacterium lizhenjunii TaxID=2709394 RepID=A0A7T0KGL6_9CORY|nr:MFS transporter [Corynebacterium lizhenjunii]QPK79398.1 MFS transporter [Corynebacterium lizhenjunii]
MAAVYSLAATYFLSALCGSMTGLTVALYFASLDSGELFVSAIMVAGMTAQVFVAPLLAPLFDRYSAYRISFVTLCIEIVVLSLMAALPTPLVLIAGGLVNTCLAGLSGPAFFTIIDAQAPEGAQAKVFSLLDTGRFAGRFLGPVMGGLLLDLANIRVALLFEVVASVICLLVLALVYRSADRGALVERSAPPTSMTFLQKVIEAPKMLLTTPSSRQALTSIWAAIIFTSIFGVAQVFFATQTLELSGAMYAILSQAFIVGRIVGARLGGRLNADNALRCLVGGGVVLGLSVGLPGVFPSVVLAMACFFVGGVANSVQVAALRLVVIGAVPEQIKPKALSAMGAINNSAMLIGYVIGAPVVGLTGPATAFIISGFGTVVLTLGPALVRAARRRT